MNLAKKTAARLLRSVEMYPWQNTEEDFLPPIAVSGGNPKTVAYLIGDPFLSVPMCLIRYSDGRPYTYEQHHLLQYYHNGLPSLRNFYVKHQPANLFEFLFLAAFRPNTHEWGVSLLSHLIQRDSPIPGPFANQWFHHKTLNRNEESGESLPSDCAGATP